MSNSFVFQITPKKIDADNNENELDSYVINEDYTDSTEYISLIPIADKYISLPALDNIILAEFVSDQPIHLSVWDGNTILIEYENVKNIIFNASLQYVFKVRNISDDEANIIWRVYK